jgi:uncharacterized RDD family membrane protein YckC
MMSQQPPGPDVPALQPEPVQPPNSLYPAAYPVAAPAPAPHSVGPAPGLRYAGFGWRALGYIFDLIVLFVIQVPITVPLVYVPIAQYYRDHPARSGQSIAALPPDLANRFLLIGVLGALVSAVYFGGLVAWQGRTLGQRVMGTSVVRAEDGGRLPLGRAYLRAVVFWGPGVIGIVPSAGSVAGLIALIALLSAAWDQRRQGWHDKLARALVVKPVPL